MKLMRYVQVKDKLVVLMVVCILSNVVLSIFSIDYLRKMSWRTTSIQEESVQPLLWLDDLENTQQQLDNAVRANTALPDKNIEAIAEWKQLDVDNKMPVLAKRYEEEYDALVQNIESEKFTEDQYNEVYLPASVNIHNILTEAQENIVAIFKSKHIAYEADIKFGYKLLLIIGALVTLLIISMSLFTSRSVRLPTRELNRLLKYAEQGDFSKTATYTARDELGDVMLSYNRMTTQVQSLLSTVQLTAADVTKVADTIEQATSVTTISTKQITAHVGQISQATQQSTEQLKINETSLQEVEQGIEYITARMNEVEQFADSTIVEAEQGTAIVEHNMIQMKKIQQSAEKSNGVVQTLASRTTDIGKIVEVITALAEQTNLLALNAAIEAAHAGEQGKGFAIVAAEVRNLAEKSIESTKLITTIVRDIQTASSDTVVIMSEVVTAAEEGVTVTAKTANKFNDIFTQIESMKPHVMGVSHTLKEILHHTAEVTEAAATLTRFSEDNASYALDVEKLTTEQRQQMQTLYQNADTIAKVSKQLQHATAKFTAKQ